MIIVSLASMQYIYSNVAMRHTLLFVFLLLLFSSAHSQVYPSNCTATTDMVKIFRNDAYRVAINRLATLNLNWKDSINIPPIYIDTVASAFYAVYNMQWAHLKDTILTLFGTSAFSSSGPGVDSSHFYYVNGDAFSAKTIEFRLLSSANWYSSWQGGNYNATPDANVNLLVNQYGLVPHPWIDLWPGYRFYDVSSARALNPYGLVRAFQNLPGTSDVLLKSNYVGDGNSINVLYQPDGLKLVYRHACGDCPSGCTYGRTWEFKYYYANCSVEYLTGYNWGGTISQWNGDPYTCIATIMPVDFSNIKVSVKNGLPQLEWQVYAETAMKEYIVERSADGIAFNYAGKINVTGNSTVAVNYSWTDKELLGGKIFYRVKAVKLNGEAKYSNVVSLEMRGSAGFLIYPNPVTGRSVIMQVNIAGSGDYCLQLFDAAGRRIYSNNYFLNSGYNRRECVFPVDLKAGIYLLVIFNKTAGYQQVITFSKLLDK
jgi:hypothetical protein